MTMYRSGRQIGMSGMFFFNNIEVFFRELAENANAMTTARLPHSSLSPTDEAYAAGYWSALRDAAAGFGVSLRGIVPVHEQAQLIYEGRRILEIEGFVLE